MSHLTGSAYWSFIGLHRQAVLELYRIDLLFGALSAAYLLVPVPGNFDYTRAVVTVLLIVFFFIIAHVKTLRSRTAPPATYRLLPVAGMPYALLSHGVTMLPFMLLFPAVAIAAARVPALVPQGPSLTLRVCHITTVYILIKSLSLPTMLFMKRHPIVLVAFYSSLALQGLAVSILHEFFWDSCVPGGCADLLCFSALVFFVGLWMALGNAAKG